jgi:hypothetical protein
MVLQQAKLLADISRDSANISSDSRRYPRDPFAGFSLHFWASRLHRECRQKPLRVFRPVFQQREKKLTVTCAIRIGNAIQLFYFNEMARRTVSIFLFPQTKDTSGNSRNRKSV